MARRSERQCPRQRPRPLLSSAPVVLAANTVPTCALRMIHSGKFLPDDKTLKGAPHPVLTASTLRAQIGLRQPPGAGRGAQRPQFSCRRLSCGVDWTLPKPRQPVADR